MYEIFNHKINVFWNFFFKPHFAESALNKISKTLILAFEANSADAMASLNCTFFQILAHYESWMPNRTYFFHYLVPNFLISSVWMFIISRFVHKTLVRIWSPLVMVSKSCISWIDKCRNWFWLIFSWSNIIIWESKIGIGISLNVITDFYSFFSWNLVWNQFVNCFTIFIGDFSAFLWMI